MGFHVEEDAWFASNMIFIGLSGARFFRLVILKILRKISIIPKQMKIIIYIISN